MQTVDKTQTALSQIEHTSDYHILVEQNQDVWNAKLENISTGEVMVFHRPIDLVRWLERRAKLEQSQLGLA